jgi:hypothetical protein
MWDLGDSVSRKGRQWEGRTGVDCRSLERVGVGVEGGVMPRAMRVITSCDVVAARSA